ncbi:MAG: tetratricopeptide repeat protein [Candidatus Competibacter sp.]|nr:tetratricopeptide repeat protein [Candidatus Competibacter sp.]HRD50884.1 tetratricopeptide repeat protein [Candidatus Contendobacter sp.]
MKRSTKAERWFDEGVQHYQAGDPQKALDAWERAESLYRDLISDNQPQYRPNLADTRMNQGVALRALNRPKDARARYEEAAAIYQDLIAAGQPQYRPDLAHTWMSQGNALSALNRPEDARARYEEAAAIYQDLIAAGQPQYRPNLVKTLVNAATVYADRTDGLETAIVYLDLALEVWEGDEAIPAVAINDAPRLAALIHQTRSTVGLAARVERLVRQIASALSGVTPENLGQFYPLAEQAFARLFGAALDENAWDLALTVIGTARAQRLAKLAQADLLHRAAREDDPAELDKYRKALRRIAELEILLNVGTGPGGGGTTSGRGGGEDAGKQYQTLYSEYTAKRRELDGLEPTLRQQGLLPDLGAGLFDGAGLRNKLPPRAALLVLVESGEPLANLVVVLTRAGGHTVLMEGGSAWTVRLEGITETLKGRGRMLRDGPGLDTRTASAEANASGTPQASADAQAKALTETLAEQFWRPVQSVLGDEIETVWLLPTGDLHGLPWQASAPPDWRCRLAPAPWFVRQALDRTPAAAPPRWAR